MSTFHLSFAGAKHHGPTILHRFVESVTPTALRRIGVTTRLIP